MPLNSKQIEANFLPNPAIYCVTQAPDLEILQFFVYNDRTDYFTPCAQANGVMSNIPCLL